MKNLLIISVLFCQCVIAQFKEIVIIDKSTGQPLEFVNVYYPELNEGSITNHDGHVKIIARSNPLFISHLGYEQLNLSGEKIKDKDTLYLTSKFFEIDEVVISPFDIKKALLYVLDHYHSLYVDYPTLKECSFKETVKVDNRYRRLILSQIQWWSKNSAYIQGKQIEKYTKFWLGNTECSKIIPAVAGINDNAYLKTKSMIKNLYLNYNINVLLHNSTNIEQTGRKNSETETVIYFETGWDHQKDISVKFDGAITFDKQTRAIIECILNTQLDRYIKEGVSETDSIPYVSVTKRKTDILRFSKGKNNKWHLRNFDVQLGGYFTIKGETHDFLFNNNITVLKEIKREKIKETPPIDMDKPIYKNFATNEINSNSIILSKEEQDFVSTDD